MSLRFYPPQGELKFWSILWLIYGVLGSVYALVYGIPAMLIMTIPVGLLTLGVWLRIKVCGQILCGVLIVTSLLAIPLIFKDGGFDWRRLFRVCLSAYFASLAYRWVEGSKPPESEPGLS